MIALRRGLAGYPVRLLDLPRPPEVLWVSGEVATLDLRPAVAIVGTRRITPYGERVAGEIARAVANAGGLVVSGLAHGVDSEAHRAALDEGGRSIAVLGEGIAAFDAAVRGRRRVLATRLRGAGALVSEYPPTAHALGWMFAGRNTTIAALADAVVIVEAGEPSGALITADHTTRLGRPLYAVPGPLGAPRSAGTNALIASGRARAITSVAALVEALGLRPGGTSPNGKGPSRLAALLAPGPLSTDELARQLRLPLIDAASLLAQAVLAGEIVLSGDGRITLTGRGML